MKKKKKTEVAETHPDLQGLDIRVNEFGEIVSNISVEQINHFLDKNVLDKKLDEEAWRERINPPEAKKKQKITKKKKGRRK